MKFVILSPRQIGGGPVVLHLLCRELRERGHDAKILYITGRCRKRKPGKLLFWGLWALANGLFAFRRVMYELSRCLSFGHKAYYEDYFRSPVKGTKRKWLPFVSDDTIVIYPDIIYGNVLNAKKVVRYLLYFYLFSGDKNAYGKDDLFFCYRAIFNDSKLNPDGNTMCLQHFDFDLYRDYAEKPRRGICYILRKGRERDDIPKELEGPVIDGWSEADKVKAFNTYKYCYTYDTQTFYTVIAAVCGCIPVIIPEFGKTKEDYLSTGEHPLGVAYGTAQAELDFAVATRQDCIRSLHMYDEWNKNAVENFLRICKNYFDEIE